MRLPSWLEAHLQRRYERRHPTAGVVAVELAADPYDFATTVRIRALQQTPGVVVFDFRQLRAAVERAAKAIKTFANNPAVQRAVRQHTDLQEIRMVGAVNLILAEDHLDKHVAGIYADLGLERPR